MATLKIYLFIEIHSLITKKIMQVIEMSKKVNDSALQESVEAAKVSNKNKKAAKERKESLGERRK